MMLSKLITANRREAIAAPEMSTRATMRNNEAVFATVTGDRSEGREYASGMALGALAGYCCKRLATCRLCEDA
jgi:hypothetical protein